MSLLPNLHQSSQKLISSFKPLSSWSRASAAVTISCCLLETTRNELAVHKFILHLSYPHPTLGFSEASKEHPSILIQF